MMGSSLLREPTASGVIDINIFSVIDLTKLFVRERVSVRKPGIIISIGSIVANSGYRGWRFTTRAKGALKSMTKAMARDGLQGTSI